MNPLATVAAAPVRPGPGRARSWLHQELSRPEYHHPQPLVDRLMAWLNRLWQHLTDSAQHASSLSTAVAVLVCVLLVVVVALAVGRLRGQARAPRNDDPLLGPAGTSAAGHHAAAAAALDEGRYDDAVVEAFRATATRTVERGLLRERPGLTAHEIADAVREVAPQQRDRLAAAAGAFDAVFYGHRSATAEQAAEILALDDALRVLRPGRTASHAAPGSLAVPR